MIYEFKCHDCDLVLEHLCPMGEQPKYKKCPKCGTRCEQTIYAPFVATSGMGQASLDVVVGRDAEKRWNRIHQRQEQRDKVRSDSGKTALTKTGKDEYKAHSRPLDFVPCTGTEGKK